MTVLGVLYFICLCTISAQSISYSGYKVVRVVPTTDKQLEVLQDLYQNQIGHRDYDFWKPPGRLGAPVDISLSPEKFDGMIAELRGHGMICNITIHDVEKLAVLQKCSLEKNDNNFNYGEYHRLHDIHNWMVNLTKHYPEKVSLINIGESYEGRLIKGLKMLDTYDTNPSVKAVVDTYDWYILPVLNVDGYDYTWTTDRMWRKTRSLQSEKCYGVDANRNWDMHWCEVRASKNPCIETYCGPRPFSEVETLAVANFLQQIPNLKVFIDFHSYSQLWMTSWGYTENLPPGIFSMYKAGKVAVTALQGEYGTEFELGSISNTLYPFSGGTTDWVLNKLKIEYPYTVELRDTGHYGFLLPANQIIPSGKETFAAVKALAKYIHNSK